MYLFYSFPYDLLPFVRFHVCNENNTSYIMLYDTKIFLLYLNNLSISRKKAPVKK
jgi:hypothetical protein